MSKPDIRHRWFMWLNFREHKVPWTRAVVAASLALAAGSVIRTVRRMRAAARPDGPLAVGLVVVGLAGFGVAHVAPARYAPAAPALTYYKAEGTIGPEGTDLCWTVKSFNPGAVIHLEPCLTIGTDAGQLFTAIQVKVPKLPAAVLAVTLFAKVSEDKFYTSLCVGGRPGTGRHAVLYDCTEGLDVLDGMYIYGGSGIPNQISNIARRWLNTQTNPVTWAKVPANSRKWVFRGELTMNGWEEVSKDSPPPSGQWWAAFIRYSNYLLSFESL